MADDFSPHLRNQIRACKLPGQTAFICQLYVLCVNKVLNVQKNCKIDTLKQGAKSKITNAVILFNKITYSK